MDAEKRQIELLQKIAKYNRRTMDNVVFFFWFFIGWWLIILPLLFITGSVLEKIFG